LRRCSDFRLPLDVTGMDLLKVKERISGIQQAYFSTLAAH